MKRVLHVISCFALCICIGLLPVPGHADLRPQLQKNGDIDVEQKAENIAVVNGTVYISYTDYNSGNGGVTIENPITGASEFYADQYSIKLISNAAQQRYAMHGVGVYRLEDGEAKPLFKDEISLFYTEAILSSAVVGDMLFLHIEGGQWGRLVRFSLEDGTYATINNCQPRGIAAGPDQALYVLQKGSSEEFPAEIALYDARGRWIRTVTGIERADAFGLACDQTNGDLYWMDDSTLYRWRNGETTELRKLPITRSRVGETCFASGYYCVRTMDFAAYLFDPDLAQEQTVLVIREQEQNYRKSEDGDFMLEHPSIILQRERKEHYCAEEVFEAIQNGDDTVDLFRVEMTASLRALMEKGYLLPLDNVPELADSVRELYPVFQDALTAEGALYAVPYQAIIRGWKVDAELAERVENPSTIDELITAFEDWEGDPLNDGQDLVKDWSAMDLARYVLQQYIMEKVSHGEEATFQDALFREYLARTRGLVENGVLGTSESGDGAEALYEATKDGEKYYGVTSVYGLAWKEQHTIASPAWQEGEAGKNAVQLFVYVVNPLSHHQQEAMEYLIYEIANWPDYILAPMKADVEPVMSSSTYEIIAEHRQNAREWREKITDDLDEQSKLSYTRIAEAEEKLAQNQYDDIGNWNIYGSALESYRAYVMPNLFIQTSRLLEGSEQTHAPVWDELVKTVQQYMEGFTSLDQCVQRLGQIARALALEE